MSLLNHALEAVSMGFHIFPCNPAGTVCPETGKPIEKMPHLIRPDRPYKLRWGEVATNDVSKVVTWWTYSPNANIGIACAPSGLLVIDADVPKREYVLKGTPWEYLHDELGPWVDGVDALRELCRRFGDDYSRLERTRRVCTASLGLHLLLWWPREVRASQASPVPGLVDVRSNGGTRGGYVLGPGSVTQKGAYVVENEGAPILSATDFPYWIELVRERPRPAPVKPLFSQPGRAGYSGLVETVRMAPEGNRSNALYWAARAMFDDGAPEEEAIEILGAAAQEAGLTFHEAQQTIRSGYRGQARKAGR